MTSSFQTRWWLRQVFLALIVIALIFLCAMIGERFLNLIPGMASLSGQDRQILWMSRVPRILLAAMTGMALGASGTAFQGLLQNSLADPYILGVSSGAALGSILGLALGLPFGSIPILAFTCSLAAMLIVYGVAQSRGRMTPHTLLLTGVILNAFLFAFILILNGVVRFEKSQKILYLLIGSIDAEDTARLLFSGILVLAGLAILTLEGHALNLMTAGSDTARSLGLSPSRHRRIIFFAASLMVGAVVPLAGLVGFVGLFVPHITRLIFGNDHRTTIPASAWIGAMMLMICDTIARTALIHTELQTELPVGAITALVGAPFFLILMKRRPR